MDTIGEGQQKRHTKITLRPRKTNKDCCLPEKNLVPKISGGLRIYKKTIFPINKIKKIKRNQDYFIRFFDITKIS